MSKEKRLARGLESLLGKASAVAEEYSLAGEYDLAAPLSDERHPYDDELYESEPRETATDKILGELMREKPIYDIPISLIDRNKHQPRLDFDDDELAGLAESLKKHGMIQPVVVRRVERRFELLAGERRLRAAQIADWEKVPAHILIVDDREMAEIALTENLQRRDLNAIEKAIAFRNYIEEYGVTNDELAKRLSLDRSTICNLIRLLELPEEIQQMVRRDELAMGHVRALLGIRKETQLKVAEKACAEGWSVRQVEEYAKELKRNPTEVDGDRPGIGSHKGTVELSDHFLDVERQFKEFFGTKVKLSANAKGKGK
jgi:ParB family chromosome partitioning protein